MYKRQVSGQGSDPGIEKQFDPGGVQLWGICSDRNTGGCRTFQDPLENKRGDGVYFHSASDDPGDHSGNGTDGIFLYAEPAIWNADKMCIRDRQRIGSSNCLAKTQVYAKPKGEVYGLTPARCWKVKRRS